MQDPDCVFCRIFEGKISAEVIAQNKNAMAVLDAFPLAVGHTLVISKSHQPKMQELAAEEAQDMFSLLQKTLAAVEGALGAGATTIAIHNGREAGQEIPHTHVHIIPRAKGDGAGPVHSMFRNRPTVSAEEMNSIRSRISERLEKNQ